MAGKPVRRNLTNLDKDVQWNLQVAQNGGVRFVDDVRDGSKVLPDHISVALALNEAGRRAGRGKVFWIHSGSSKVSSVRLIFRREVWSSVDQEIWNSYSQRARAEAIIADTSVALEDLVMPLEFFYNASTQTKVKIGDGKMGPQFTKLNYHQIVYDPRPHVASREDIRPKRMGSFGDPSHAIKTTSYQGWWDGIRVQGGNEGVISRLCELWKYEQNVCTFREVFNEVRIGA